MQSFSNKSGINIIYKIIETVQKNKDYLSEIDGLIGDGDHGINMNKGFTMCAKKLEGHDEDITSALKILARTLLSDIGGSMGPLYGSFFNSMAKASVNERLIDSKVFLSMLEAGVSSIKRIGGAKVGDKTLIDVLSPALDAYTQSINNGHDFKSALKSMQAAAITGRDSTINLVAKLGRSSRLGERSRGVLDAGAASCCLILCTMAEEMLELINDI